MPLPIISQVWRVTYSGQCPSGSPWANCYHAKWTGTGTFDPLTQLPALNAKLSRIYTGSAYALGAPWLSLCHATCTMAKAVFYPLDGTGQVTELSAVGVGSGGGNSLPSETAFVVTLRTPTRGRRYRGRVYMPPPTVNATTTSGVLGASNQTFINKQFEGLLADLPSINWELHVASYGESWLKNRTDPHGAMTHSTWTPFSTKITLTSVDTKADVQRHRK